jgi:putative hydrolase of the HAD superfamily
MNQPQPIAALFDADGVTIIPQDPFSVQYATSRGLDPKVLRSFFDDRFDETLIGKRDLKELLNERRELWQWEGSSEDLLQLWFQAENHRNEALIAVIQQARQNGIQCYLATNQEQYRTMYVKDIMFPRMFDGVFSSSFMGTKKPDPDFYKYILNDLSRSQVITHPNNLVYFDDQSSNVESAKDVGIRAYLYKDVQQVARLFQ